MYWGTDLDFSEHVRPVAHFTRGLAVTHQRWSRWVCSTAKPFPFIPAASISSVDMVATPTATGALGKEGNVGVGQHKHAVHCIQAVPLGYTELLLQCPCSVQADFFFKAATYFLVMLLVCKVVQRIPRINGAGMKWRLCSDTFLLLMNYLKHMHCQKRPAVRENQQL